MTSLFKQQLKKDVKNIFFNFSEFADFHSVELGRYPAVNILVVIDGDLIKERYKATDSLFVDGVFRQETFAYIQVDDLPEEPVNNEILRLDGKLFIIKDVNENMGVYEITIISNET